MQIVEQYSDGPMAREKSSESVGHRILFFLHEFFKRFFRAGIDRRLFVIPQKLADSLRGQCHRVGRTVFLPRFKRPVVEKSRFSRTRFGSSPACGRIPGNANPARLPLSHP